MPAVVLEFASRCGGKSALMWHRLAQESKASGRPIRCVVCLRPHTGPPRFGKCPCGGYAFGVHAQLDTQQQLELDMHAGEQ